MIENIKSSEDLLLEAKEAALSQCDTNCSAHIHGSISAERQMNAAIGLLSKDKANTIRQEILSALAENSGFIADIKALTSIDDIKNYMGTIAREDLTGAR